MIEFTNDLRVMVGIDPIDFRAGMNKLAAIAQAVFDEDPRGGICFVFCNRRRTDIKLLGYDGNGFFLGHKRLSKGKLSWWPRTEHESLNITASELVRLLKGVDPRGSFHPDWHPFKGDEHQGRSPHIFNSAGLPRPTQPPSQWQPSL